MSKTNCINCGAAKEVSDMQCPFCGTKYADLTTFNLFGEEPIYIQLLSHHGNIITSKAYISNRKLVFEPCEIASRKIDGTLYRKQFGTRVSGSIDFVLFESIDGGCDE